MTRFQSLSGKCSVLILPIVMLAGSANAQKNSKYVCAEPDPASLCNAGNTCGTASSPCVVDVKRTANLAASTPQLPGAKGNMLFCVHPSTKITWQSSSKNTGILVDAGDPSPFDPDGPIIGGSTAPRTVTAKKPGCYKYSAGACVSGAIYGMCKTVDAEFVILPN